MIANLVFTLINVLILGYVITTLTASLVKASMIMMVFLFLSFITSFLPILSPKGFNTMKYLTPNGLWMNDINYLCWNKSGIQLHYHILYFMALILILYIIESRILQNISHKFWTWFLQVDFSLPHYKDPSVEKEEQVVKNMFKSQLASKTLVVDNVKRWFPVCCKPSESCSCSFPAVKGVSFTIDKAECFGLVGKNGAGKSTIFNILTGVLVPSYGGAYLKAVSIRNYCLSRRAFSAMGYCSQFGNYLPDFKGKEMLQLFARLKGFRGSDLKKEVRMRLMQVSVEEYENKQCKSYSGGTLRKLSSAMAVIGNPTISLMDEPTSGVDPVSRRSIWNLINHFRETGHSILLTFHSMDECEVLCTRLAMITKGRLRCVGEATQIKDLFGQNYIVTLKTNVKASEINILELKVAVQDIFKVGWLLLSEHLTILRYQITKETVTWKKLFTELNLLKSKFKFIEFFSATSVSLEEIFLQFDDDDKYS